MDDHSAQQGRTALKTVLRILIERWGLSVADAALLLDTDPESLRAWRETPEQAAVTDDLYLRLSYLLGIYKALAILVPDRAAAEAWMTRANDNPLCHGHAPIEVLREQGARLTDLREFRRYLDGELQ